MKNYSLSEKNRNFKRGAENLGKTRHQMFLKIVKYIINKKKVVKNFEIRKIMNIQENL